MLGPACSSHERMRPETAARRLVHEIGIHLDAACFNVELGEEVEELAAAEPHVEHR